GREFGLGDVVSFQELTAGKVNHTYKVEAFLGDAVQSFIFQNVNTYVFHRPREVMENIRRVTEHIERYNPEMLCIHYRTTASGETFFDMITSFWRVYRFIDSVTYNSSRDPIVVRNAGAAFGQFQRSLRNFDSSFLHYTIKDFHNTTRRLSRLEQDFERNPLGLSESCAEEFSYIMSMKDKALLLDRLAAEGKIPVRVTHNDTKINNVLFNAETGEAICVVDLDTVMPGYAGHDFGDAVRSCANSMGSASLEFDKVRIDLDIYRAFAEGFLSKTADVLTDQEKDSLAGSCLVMALELASRYIDDYLTGDRYFKAKYPTQNLDRARNLIALAKDMDRNMDRMKAIVGEI
ncbi:MAG: aminoglycoside phosphotransferase family protein, partial [Spirochaetales bacterium]|nr:aminoglycoside phosphotransferase family protein [Spirochaetales bacterium]